MKSIVQMFLPFFIFLFFTLVLFFNLKNDNTTPSDNSRKQVREIFDDVDVRKDVNVRKEVKVKRYKRSGSAEVTHVRWNHHNGFERLVFDVTEDNSATFTMAIDGQDNTKVHGELVGYRAFSQTLPNFRSSNIVKEMKVYELSDNSYKFTISLYRPMEYKAFALKKPARIVIDMY